MKTRGPIPRVAIEADVILALEAPGDEKISPGGHDIQIPPYVEIELAANGPALDEALARWHAGTWGGEA